MTEAVLYQWPPAAAFGRVVPKLKFYERGAVSPAIRERFVAEVQRITWAYKLAETTIHLRGNRSVPELQIFGIDAKGDDVDDRVLQAIDRTVRFPIIYEVNRGEGADAWTRMCAAHKHPGGRQPMLSAYFSTSWLPARTERQPLPPAVDLAALYVAVLEPLLPLDLRPGESLAAAVGRVEGARELEREIAGLERRIRTEPQLNRKIELRRQLGARIESLADMTDPDGRPVAAGPEQEEPQWTS
jgi:hypothetical protein